MKIIFDEWKNFRKEKPEDFQTCLILWDSAKKAEITVGIYYSDKKAFFDGIGGWLEENLVRMWIDASNYKVEKER